MAGFAAGIGIGLAFIFYRWAFKPVNLSAFPAASILVPTGFSALVMVLAACAYPARGEAAERASWFWARIGRTAPASEVEASPAPVAGLVIATMGLVLVAIGSGFALSPRNLLTLVTGAFLGIVGLSILKAGHLYRRLLKLGSTREHSG
jgi:hypothetical protein